MTSSPLLRDPSSSRRGLGIPGSPPTLRSFEPGNCRFRGGSVRRELAVHCSEIFLRGDSAFVVPGIGMNPRPSARGGPHASAIFCEQAWRSSIFATLCRQINQRLISLCVPSGVKRGHDSGESRSLSNVGRLVDLSAEEGPSQGGLNATKPDTDLPRMRREEFLFRLPPPHSEYSLFEFAVTGGCTAWCRGGPSFAPASDRPKCLTLPC